jgi:hypothetical protein
MLNPYYSVLSSSFRLNRNYVKLSKYPSWTRKFKWTKDSRRHSPAILHSVTSNGRPRSTPMTDDAVFRLFHPSRRVSCVVVWRFPFLHDDKVHKVHKVPKFSLALRRNRPTATTPSITLMATTIQSAEQAPPKRQRRAGDTDRVVLDVGGTKFVTAIKEMAATRFISPLVHWKLGATKRI